ncbi:MAG: FtsQ-type POTRA domain-containing protein [Puniceicoccales bacterium]|jgi:cell division septal protein FtsQ|nr:FtsQ-type POTRA domain-containing protein [Puniceicoccales bacterium]
MKKKSKIAEVKSPKKQGRAKARSSDGTVKKSRKRVDPARFVLVFVLICCAVFLAVSLGQNCLQRVRSLVENRLAVRQRLERVEIVTTGTMPKDMILHLLRLPKVISLGEIDVRRCRARLLQSPQIAEAHVARCYPNALRVKVLERVPILKMRGTAEVDWLFVAADGVIFLGVGLPQQAINAMPRLEGVNGTAHATLPFFPKLYRALSIAKTTNPNIYSTWHTIAVANASDGEHFDEFEARSVEVHHLYLRIADIPRQIEELEYILCDARRRRLLPLERVDLSIPGRAYVKPAGQP